MALANSLLDLGEGVASATIRAIIKQIKDVVELDQSLQLLNSDFGYMNSMLFYIDQQFHSQQRSLPVTIEEYLRRMSDVLNEGQQLISRADRQRRRCFGCCLICNCILFTQIRDWRTRFDKRFQEFVNVFSVIANTRHIVPSAPSQRNLLLEDEPDVIVGPYIASAQVTLQAWLTEPAHSQARVIGIYGMGGVGKSSVLKVIHNNYKEKVRGIFDAVIWNKVSMYKSEKEDDKIEELQFSIAYTLHLDLKDCHTLDIRKRKLSAALKSMRFLLILDDLWSKIDLDKVGVKFGHDKGSKVLISSRSREVIIAMGATDYSLIMQPLSPEDGWELFRRKAFANGAVPEKNIETTAQEIARECKGLPLALNVVAAAMSSETDLSKWRNALEFMRNVDPTFRDTHSTIYKDVYQRLGLSYTDLSDTLKSCFLYTAAFPENAKIEVETLVEMWSAEGLIPSRGYLMEVGREYIDALVKRCLIEYADVKRIWIPWGDGKPIEVEREMIRVHDLLRDMAIYIGERDEDSVFASGQHLQQFPRGEVTRKCKRLSVSRNDIKELPTDLECSTKLQCLVLANCQKLTKVPAASFSNMVSLKVLDLSFTLITSLPTSVEQLGQLEFLNLSGCTLLKELPESICRLSRLQFLNLNYCESLVSLPDKIGDLQSLKHLNFDTCDYRDTSLLIPRGIFGFTSLTKLCLPMGRSGCAISMEDLKNLSNLRELRISVKAHSMKNCDCRWLKNIRKLALRYQHDANGGTDDAPGDAKADSSVAVDDGDADSDVIQDGDEDETEDILPPLQNTSELQSLWLLGYLGRSLPNYIGKLLKLEELRLWSCAELRELPVLEIRGDTASASFPMLKKLRIVDCPLIKRLPIGIETLCKLKEIQGDEDWWSGLIWEDEAARRKLEPLFEIYTGNVYTVYLNTVRIEEYSPNVCSIM